MWIISEYLPLSIFTVPLLWTYRIMNGPSATLSNFWDLLYLFFTIQHFVPSLFSKSFRAAFSRWLSGATRLSLCSLIAFQPVNSDFLVQYHILIGKEICWCVFRGWIYRRSKRPSHHLKHAIYLCLPRSFTSILDRKFYVRSMSAIVKCIRSLMPLDCGFATVVGTCSTA